MIDRIPPVALSTMSKALHQNAPSRTDAKSAPAPDTGAKSQLSDIAREASASPVGVDAGRVAAVREAISTGNYKIEPSAIAASILTFYRS